MRFKGLDLNLLAVFDVLLQTRSVSAAARQINLSQPAMSAALARLRDYFDDEILVVQGKRMYPTAFAEALLPKVRRCLSEVEGLLATSSKFDPATSQRTFRLIISDYIVTAVVVPLIADLAREAPGVRLELALPSETSEAQINEGRADLFVSPELFMLQDQPAELFFEERHVVAGWAKNPIFDAPLTEETLREAGYVGVRIGDHRALAFADQQLNQMGFHRRIEVEAPSFTTIPWLLCETHRLAFMHERLALRMAEIFPLRWEPIPFAFPVMREMIQYHRSRSSDEGLQWLRQRLQEAARPVAVPRQNITRPEGTMGQPESPDQHC